MILILSLFMSFAHADGMGCQILYTNCMAGIDPTDNRAYKTRDSFCKAQQDQCNDATRDINSAPTVEDAPQE